MVNSFLVVLFLMIFVVREFVLETISQCRASVTSCQVRCNIVMELKDKSSDIQPVAKNNKL